MSDEAKKLLKALFKIKDNNLVFPVPRGGKLSDMSITMLTQRVYQDELDAGRSGFLDSKQNKAATTHGFRSTFRDWSADETDHPREVCEHALAYKLSSGVEAAYLRTDYPAKRAGLTAD